MKASIKNDLYFSHLSKHIKRMETVACSQFLVNHSPIIQHLKSHGQM